jgi:hypothetical protein
MRMLRVVSKVKNQEENLSYILQSSDAMRYARVEESSSLPGSVVILPVNSGKAMLNDNERYMIHYVLGMAGVERLHDDPNSIESGFIAG